MPACDGREQSGVNVIVGLTSYPIDIFLHIAFRSRRLASRSSSVSSDEDEECSLLKMRLIQLLDDFLESEDRLLFVNTLGFLMLESESLLVDEFRDLVDVVEYARLS